MPSYSTAKPTDGTTTTKGGSGNSCSGDPEYPCASSDNGNCWGYPCCDDGYCNFDDSTKPTDGTTTGNSCSGDPEYPCASSDNGNCWGYPCCDDGYCNFDDKKRSTGSDFNRVVLFNGYLPTTHLGLISILDSAAPVRVNTYRVRLIIIFSILKRNLIKKSLHSLQISITPFSAYNPGLRV